MAAPAGYHSLTPRIVVADVDAQVAWLRSVFGATGDVVAGRPAELRIGDSLVMVTEAGERELFPAFLYVYVDDAEVTFERAVAAGCDVDGGAARHALRRPPGDGARPVRQRVPDRPPALSGVRRRR